MQTPTGPMLQSPDTNNQSESALKKTLQKLLKKRSSKANKKLEKDLQHSSSQWQSYTQKPVQAAYPATDQPVLAELPPDRVPRPSTDTEEVCVIAATVITFCFTLKHLAAHGNSAYNGTEKVLLTAAAPLLCIYVCTNVLCYVSCSMLTAGAHS